MGKKLLKDSNVWRTITNSLKALEIKYQLKKKGLPSAVENVYFDFADEESMSQALKSIDVLFLLRPPQLTNVNKYFKSLIRIAVREKIDHSVFLSVQGA